MAGPFSRSRLKLDLPDERLWDGDRVIDLPPKLFSILRYFVLHPNRLLTKREILSHVWPTTNVTEGSVKDCVQNLRRALGDDSKRPRFIETVRGRGYRYVGDIEVARPCGNRFPIEKKHADAPYLVVLPFETLNDNSSPNHLSQRVTSDLITRLHKTGMFNVAPETLTVDYRNRTAGVEELREALGVRFVINGNVESLGSLVRITVRLVSSATKETLWTEKFDGEVNDLFKDLDGIIQSIVGHLLGAYRSSVLRESKLRVENDADNLGIDDYLLCGFYYWHRCTAEANAKARRMFEKAFELAPNSSGPCQALAWCRSQEVRFAWCEDPGKALTLAHDMARRALVLDETHFESHWVLGHVSLLKRDYEIALTEFQNALQLSPDVPHLIADFSDFMVYLGKPQDALAYINRAVTLNPYYPDWYAGIMARANADVGNIEAAADIYHSISTTSEDYRLEFTALLVQLSRLEEAWIEAKQQLRNHPDFSLKRYAELYSWKHPYRDRKRAEEKLERHLHSLRMAGLPG